MRRFLAVLLSLLVAFNFVWVKPAYASIDYSMIRVALTSMGAPTSIDLYVNGSYTIEGYPDIKLESGIKYTIALASGKLQLKNGSSTYTLSSPFMFKREDGHLRIYNKSYGWKNYRGDMEVRTANGGIRLVNHIDMETYLYGVLPFEMSNSWPLEALKAQAVAARTYAARARRSSSYYDVYDTQDSQVYEGYDPIYDKCIRAVDETRGQVLMYKGKFVGTFYSASNGGKTEASKNIFVEDLPYSVVKDDPYDVRNTSNTRARWTVTYYKSPVDSNLQNRLRQRMKSSLSSKGYSTEDSDIIILSIKKLFFEPPNESGRIDKGYITVEVNARHLTSQWYKISYQGGEYYVASWLVTLNPSVKMPDGGILGTVKTEQLNIRKGPGTQYESIGLVPKGTELNVISTYDTIEETINFNKNNARSVLNLYSLLVSLEDRGDAYVLNGGGWGHGVGMSQYGAQQMAREGFNYTEILEFYYPTTQLTLLYGTPPEDPDQGSDPTPSASPEASQDPSASPSPDASGEPTVDPEPTETASPTASPTAAPTAEPTVQPTQAPTQSPTAKPTSAPTPTPTAKPTPTPSPTPKPTPSPTPKPTPTPTPKPTPTPLPSSGTVNASVLNVRKGPGTEYAVILQLKRGAVVQITGESGTWYKIKTNNTTGYVHKDYITPAVSPKPDPAPAPVPDPPSPPPVDPAPPPNTDTRKLGYVTASKLNVRSGPSTKNHSVGMVEKDTRLIILGKTGDWYSIEYNGKVNYVHSDYVKLLDVTLSTGTVNAGPLNVRTGPGTSYSSVGLVQKGTKLTITGKSGDWYKVLYNGKERYVSAQYLTVSQAPKEDAPQTTQTGTVNAGPLNVRTGPGTNYASVGLVQKGTKLTITGKSGDWYKVLYNGQERYVSAQYLTVTQSGTSRGDQGSDQLTGIVTASVLNVRSGPGTDYSRVGQLQRNKTVTITGVSGKWYKIKYGSTTGYVHSDYIKLQ